MFERITPEQAGLNSAELLKKIKTLTDAGHNFHTLLMMKGENIFYESCFSPFTADGLHRMYSQTKSFVAVAVGVLYDRGLVDLDAPFYIYFPEYHKYIKDERFKSQTVRQMLTMTGVVKNSSWFRDHPDDRLAHYFGASCPRLGGAWFDYDSEGSFALGCLVEKLSGKKLLDFMRESFLDEIGFGEAKMLSCPGGWSWGDSAMICSVRSLALFARLVMKKGNWNGKQLISEEYMTLAVSPHASTCFFNGESNEYAYGYQIWIPSKDSFAFLGMGDQSTLCVPEKDLIITCTSDNQCGNGDICSNRELLAALEIVEMMSDEPLSENKEAFDVLHRYEMNRTLSVARSVYGADASMQEKINGADFICTENPMGWKRFRFDFSDDVCVLEYENAQGVKKLPFGINKNVFGKFPQFGYANDIGTVYDNGRLYDCAVSANWDVGNKLHVFVQITDDYFGRASLNFCFPDEKSCGMCFLSNAEDFLWEYSGIGTAFRKNI